jgi:phage terminase large subunit-like protein
MITNSGTNKQSVCWEYHDYGAKVAAGQIEDDSFFSYVCALDIDDDPFKDEKCWGKANPSLQYGLPGIKYLREQVTQARGMPGKESIVRRLNFCQWVEASAPWIGSDLWFGAEDKEFDSAMLIGRKCWAGLDLSSTQDLTALVLIFAPDDDDPHWRLVPHFWLPGDGLMDKADKDRVPYLAWRDAGHLEALAGRAINKLAVIKRLADIASLYDLQEVGYDRWRIEDFKSMLDQEGISLPLVPFGQGFKDMAPAVDEFERLLLGGQLKHGGNPVMTWCAANAVISSDPAGNRKIAKEKATGRVDGVVAAVMAAGRAMAGKQQDDISDFIFDPVAI